MKRVTNNNPTPKKASKTEDIINTVLKYGPTSFNIGQYKTIKNSTPIKAAIKTGLVKITDSIKNEHGTGYCWVELSPTK